MVGIQEELIELFLMLSARFLMTNLMRGNLKGFRDNLLFTNAVKVLIFFDLSTETQ